MNVLVVSPRFPFPARTGADMRVYQLVRQVATRHDVTLLSYALPTDEKRVAALRDELPVEVVEHRERSGRAKRSAQLRSIASLQPFTVRELHSDGMQRAIRRLCTEKSVDIVQLEGSILCGLAMPRGVSVILDEHNVDYEVFQHLSKGEGSLTRRLFHRLEYKRFRRFEERCWARVHGCVMTSEREAFIVRKCAPATPTAVVPNGVDLEYFEPADSAVEPDTLMFNGILDYRPNFDAACHLVEEIWPLVLDRCPDARLTIVGRGALVDLRRLRKPGVVLTGEVPDLRPYLERAAVVVVPVRMGSGTRLKVVEALAMRKAVVSTSLGCEGLAVVDGEHLLIGDGAEAFASRVLELFDDLALGQSLGSAGRSLVETEYSWDLMGERLEVLYQQVAAVGCDPRNRSAVVPTV